MIQIKTYGIYQGVAAEDNLVAAAVFSLEDFKEMGRTLDEYKDYLLERQNCLDAISCRPVRIVNVPFDREAYENWLERKPYWSKKRESLSAWALDIAKNPKALSALLEKHPVLPMPPVGEETDVLALFGILPVVVTSKNELQLLAEGLPHEMLVRIIAGIRNLFSAVPNYKPLSPIRCQGIRVYAGDHFIPPFKAEEFEKIYCNNIDKILRYPGDVIPVPAKCRIKQPDISDIDIEQSKKVVLSVLLPTVIIGASAEIDYCELLLGEIQGEVNAVAKVLREYTAGMFKYHVSDAYVLFAQLPDIWDCIDYVISDSEMVVPQVKSKNSNGNIKRIK